MLFVKNKHFNPWQKEQYMPTFVDVLLLLESAADFPSVGLLNKEGELVWYETSNTQRSHAEMLPVFANQALQFIKDKQEDLSAVAVNKGPGSYTGLRIATSLAKGICLGSDVPLIGVDGLVGMSSYQLTESPNLSLSIAMLDARRDEVYAVKHYRRQPYTEAQPVILNEDIWNEDQNETVGFIGNASEKAAKLLGWSPTLNTQGPNVKQWASLAFDMWQNNQFESVAYFEPNYIKAYQPGISEKFKL
jgi:tRNA threonylcarbamoyladenosine biosynthesis protein TsaB